MGISFARARFRSPCMGPPLTSYCLGSVPHENQSDDEREQAYPPPKQVLRLEVATQDLCPQTSPLPSLSG
jgi:hypothetical protein